MTTSDKWYNPGDLVKGYHRPLTDAGVRMMLECEFGQYDPTFEGPKMIEEEGGKMLTVLKGEKRSLEAVTSLEIVDSTAKEMDCDSYSLLKAMFNFKIDQQKKLHQKF